MVLCHNVVSIINVDAILGFFLWHTELTKSMLQLMKHTPTGVKMAVKRMRRTQVDLSNL